MRHPFWFPVVTAGRRTPTISGVDSILVWLVVALLGLGAVPGTASDSAMSVESAVPAPALLGTSRVTERAFSEREMLPPCGVVEMEKRAGAKSAWRCLQDALGVEGAELVTIDSRPGGRTVSTFYRATRDGRLEVWIQRDRTGADRSRWSFSECTPSDDLLPQPCAP